MQRLFSLVLALLLLLPLAGHAAPKPQRPPKFNAQAWLLIDYDSASVLVEHNADRPLPPASLTKLMTAYLVFEQLRAGKVKLNEEVVISRKVASMRGSRMKLRSENTATVEQLIRAMLVISANDAAVALAERVSGSEELFVAEMNKRAQAWDLRGTHFKNPTGLDIHGHISTARDMMRIAVALLRDFPDYYHWFSMREFTYNNRQFHNSNGLLHIDATVDGMKTGYTARAGYCLISTAKRQNMRLMAAVLGARSDIGRIDSSRRLLDYGFRHYETRLIYAADKPATEIRVWMGDSPVLPVGVTQNLYLTLPRGLHDRLRTQVTVVSDMLYAPVKTGQPLGKLALQLDNKVFAEYPLVALKEVGTGGVMQRAVDNVQLWLQ